MEVEGHPARPGGSLRAPLIDATAAQWRRAVLLPRFVMFAVRRRSANFTTSQRKNTRLPL